MSRFLLIRHATTTAMKDVLYGRRAGYDLSEAGRAEASALAKALADIRLDMLIASPQARAQQTAAAISESKNIRVQTLEQFDEVDYGAWTGERFSDLNRDAAWIAFNSLRSISRAPEGESLRDVQYRAVTGVQELQARFPSQTVAIVTHADVVRAILTHLLGVPLDLCRRIDIDPASISAFELGSGGPAVQTVNAKYIRA
jgi:probable phosphoglycerate mutase